MTITYILGGKLYVNLTNRCPNACDFCLRTHGDGVGDAASLWLDREPTREEIWDDLKKRDLTQYPELIFCGYGEPTGRLEDMLWVCPVSYTHLRPPAKKTTWKENNME